MLLCADSTTRSRNTWHTELHFLWKGRYGVTKFDRLFLSWNKKFPSRIWNFVHWTCVLLWTTCITVYEYKKEKLSCYFSTATKAFFIIVQAAYVLVAQTPSPLGMESPTHPLSHPQLSPGRGLFWQTNKTFGANPKSQHKKRLSRGLN